MTRLQRAYDAAMAAAETPEEVEAIEAALDDYWEAKINEARQEPEERA